MYVHSVGATVLLLMLSLSLSAERPLMRSNTVSAGQRSKEQMQPVHVLRTLLLCARHRLYNHTAKRIDSRSRRKHDLAIRL